MDGSTTAAACDPLAVVPVELAIRILRMALTTTDTAPTAYGWLQHGPFAPAQFLQSLRLVSVWWRTVVTAHGRALWRLVGIQLHAALPRAMRKAPKLDKLRHLVLLPPISTMGGMSGILRICTPVRSPVSPVPQPKPKPTREPAELEWDWEDRVRECLKALHRRQQGMCWTSVEPTKVRGAVTDLWGNLAASFNLRSFGVHDAVSGQLMRLFETRGLMPTIFVALRPTASGDQVLAVLEHNGGLTLRVFDLVLGRSLVTAPLNTTVLLARAPQKRGFLSASTRWLGVYTDQEMSLWDLSTVDAALSTAEVGGPAIKLEALESGLVMEAQFCAAHPTRDAIALARPPSNCRYPAAAGTSTTAQSPTPDECLLVTVYDIDASPSGGEAAPPQLRVIATAEVPQRSLTGVAFNSRLMAVLGGQQPGEVLLFGFTPRHGNDPGQPPPLELTRLPRPLRVEAARYSMTQPCVALDDRRLYYFYDCDVVAIFDALELLASPDHTSDEAHSEGEEKVVVGQDWSHPALVAQLNANADSAVSARRGGRVGTSAAEAYADRTGVVSVVTAEAVRLLVDPCSSIGVQAGDSEDLLLFPF